MKSPWRNALKPALWVNICRLVLAPVFILSGFVKAVDPLGSQYKIADYLTAMGLSAYVPDIATLLLAVALAAFEFTLGILLLFAIRRRLTSRLTLLFMAVMTPLTLWLAVANPVSDCGCFGDAITLTNWQTFFKNMVLLGCAAVVCRWPETQFRFVSEPLQWLVVNYSALFILAVSAWCLYYLPLFDFRPYHIGANLRQGMEIPKDAPQPQFSTTFIMEKDGQRREFTLDNYPDSTWTFIDSHTIETQKGYVPPIHDFSLTLKDGTEITNDIVDGRGYTFLLIAPHLENADESRTDLINELAEYCSDHHYAFYGVSASGPRAVAQWQDMTGADYPFCTADETTLKTIIRSNPGLVLVKNGVVAGKWSHNNLPELTEEEASKPIEQTQLGAVHSGTTERVAAILLWFVLPLTVLGVADRLFLWSRWIRKKKVSTPK